MLKLRRTRSQNEIPSDHLCRFLNLCPMSYDTVVAARYQMEVAQRRRRQKQTHVFAILISVEMEMIDHNKCEQCFCNAHTHVTRNTPTPKHTHTHSHSSYTHLIIHIQQIHFVWRSQHSNAMCRMSFDFDMSADVAWKLFDKRNINLNWTDNICQFDIRCDVAHVSMQFSLVFSYIFLETGEENNFFFGIKIPLYPICEPEPPVRIGYTLRHWMKTSWIAHFDWRVSLFSCVHISINESCQLQ